MRQRLVPTPAETFDDPWNQIVTALFRQFLEFFAPIAAADIDWNQEPVFLDKELRRIAKGLRKNRVTADLLVKVSRKDGGEQWLLIHIELQAQWDADFPERMFLYSVRSFDLYRRPVFSLAVLADDSPNWRPDRFGYSHWGSEAGLRYPVVKLLDYAGRLSELEASDNPFALVVLAHLKTLETRGDAETRLAWKLRLLRLLLTRRWQRKNIEELLQFLDWIMGLPKSLDDRFDAEWEALEREQTMAQTVAPIILRAERRGEKRGELIGEQRGEQRGELRGERKARRDTLIRQMERKFGVLDDDLRAKIDAIEDIAQLDRLLDAVLTAETLADMPLPQD